LVKKSWLDMLKIIMNNRFWKDPKFLIPTIISLILLLVAVISIPYWSIWLPGVFSGQNKNEKQAAAVITPTDPINIADIIKRIENAKTSEEVQDLLDTYKNTSIIGEGEYSNKWRSEDSEGPKIGITVANGTVKCNFSTDWQKRIELLQLGDTINFLGTFRFLELWALYNVGDCSLTQ